jgi:hypothetical protein
VTKHREAGYDAIRVSTQDLDAVNDGGGRVGKAGDGPAAESLTGHGRGETVWRIPKKSAAFSGSERHCATTLLT